MLIPRIRNFAARCPRRYSGLWFSAPVFILALPLGIRELIWLGLEGPVGISRLEYLAQMIVSLGAILGSIFTSGALIGRKIVDSEPAEGIRAAGYGALTVFVAISLWLLMTVGIPILLGDGLSNYCVGGDIPGAAVVLALAIGIPLVILTGPPVGAVLGIQMHRLLNPRNKYLV